MIGAKITFLPGQRHPVTVSNHIKLGAAATGAILAGKIRYIGQRLQSRVQFHAPKASGAYADTIGLEVQSGAVTATAYVGTNAPQGRRLEFGFVGQDRRGRNYNQAPQPHFGPAVDEIGPEIVPIIRGMK